MKKVGVGDEETRGRKGFQKLNTAPFYAPSNCPHGQLKPGGLQKKCPRVEDKNGCLLDLK